MAVDTSDLLSGDFASPTHKHTAPAKEVKGTDGWAQCKGAEAPISPHKFAAAADKAAALEAPEGLSEGGHSGGMNGVEAFVVHALATGLRRACMLLRIPTGTLLHAGVIAVWLSTPIILPLWIYFFGLRGLILYGVYRYIRPVAYWPAFHQFMISLQMGSHFHSPPQVLLPKQSDSLTDRPLMLCHHPHGIYSIGFSSSFVLNPDFLRLFGAKQPRGRLHWLVYEGTFWIPIASELWGWLGSRSAARESMEGLMRARENVALIPGGLEEYTTTRTGTEAAYIAQRKGFIKLALLHGYRIIPSYTFGETSLLNCWNLVERARLWCNSKRLLVPHFFRGFCLVLPNPAVQLSTAFGDPIDCPKMDEPSKADVEKYHDLYVQSLQRIGTQHGKPIEIW